MMTLRDKLKTLAIAKEMKNKLNEKMSVDKPKNISYYDDEGKLISLNVAKSKRWAYKKTGKPTKIYKLRLAKRAARKNGELEPIRQWVPQHLNQKMGDLQSPYDLTRRSGQRLIWQALAKNPNKTMTRAELQKSVNEAYKKEFPDYYNKKYTQESPFDTWVTVIVMNRAPFNAKIEALKQRIEVDTVSETVMLRTEVTEPRQPKKRGRKSGTKNKLKESVVEVDNETSIEVNVEAVV